MESTINNGMCRCCASEGTFKDVKSSYHWMGEEEIYSDMLRECFDVSLLLSEDGNDGGICEVCITQLRNAANFKKQVQHTEEQFKLRLDGKLYKSDSIVKIEPSRGEDDDNDSDNMSGDDFSGAEYEVPIKTEKLEETKPKKRPATSKPSTSRAKKTKNAEPETSTKRIPQDIKVKLHLRTIQNYIKRLQMRSMPKAIINSTAFLKADHRKKTEPQRDVKVKVEIDPKVQLNDLISVNGKDDENVKMQKLRLRFTKLKCNRIKHMTNITEILENSNATPIKLYCDSGYKCCYCDDSYRDPADLKNHTIATHKEVTEAPFLKLAITELIVKLDITSLHCKLCFQTLTTLEELTEHLMKVHNKIMYRDLKSQIIPFKFDSDVLTCCICTSTFGRFKPLLDHMKVHFRNFICDICDIGFITKMTLQHHLNTHKTGDFKCVYCTKVFNTFVKKRSHERSVHIQEYNVNRCGICNEVFKSFQRKQTHLANTHGIRSMIYKCNSCEKTYMEEYLLSQHIRKVHLMERNYSCTKCDKTFYAQHQLRAHVVVHTQTRDLQCDVCQKTYQRKKTLLQHMRIHMNDRRYKCEYCGQAFIQKCSLKGHMRSKHLEQM